MSEDVMQTPIVSYSSVTLLYGRDAELQIMVEMYSQTLNDLF